MLLANLCIECEEGHTAQSQNRYTSRHLTLHIHRHLKHQLFDTLYSTGLHNRSLVLLRTSCQIPQRRNGMTLDFLVVLEGKEVDERLEESGFDDGGFILGVDGDVADTGG